MTLPKTSLRTFLIALFFASGHELTAVALPESLTNIARAEFENKVITPTASNPTAVNTHLTVTTALQGMSSTGCKRHLSQ